MSRIAPIVRYRLSADEQEFAVFYCYYNPQWIYRYVAKLVDGRFRPVDDKGRLLLLTADGSCSVDEARVISNLSKAEDEARQLEAARRAAWG